MVGSTCDNSGNTGSNISDNGGDSSGDKSGSQAAHIEEHPKLDMLVGIVLLLGSNYCMVIQIGIVCLAVFGGSL